MESGPGAERDLWQGLAQIAVGLTHAQRGNGRAPPPCCAGAGGGSADTRAPPVRDRRRGGSRARRPGLADRIEADGLAVAARDGSGFRLTGDRRSRRPPGRLDSHRAAGQKPPGR